jgi:hypothetical protein|tara:strand:- start:2732 stop:3358 length:627 start_codon:yes stop_codon:yes gene_type:complete
MPLGAAKAALLGAAGSGEVDAGGVFECIAKQTTSGGSTTSVEFTSIPSSTYDNIEVIISWVPATSDSSAGISWALEMEINGESTNVYNRAWIAGSGRDTDSSLTTTGYTYATQPFYMGYTQYQNGLFNRQRWSNAGSASTSHVGHTLSGSGIPNQPLGPSSQDSFWYDNYGNASGSSSSALTSIKFVSEWSRVIEDGTTFTMMGIKSS